MKKFTYRQTRLEQIAGLPLRFDHAQWFPFPVMAIAASLCLIVVAWFIQYQRLRAADVQFESVQTQLASATVADDRIDRMARDVALLRETLAKIDSWQRECLDATNAIAGLGNALPAQTWLTGVQSTVDGVVSISGRSVQLLGVGATLSRLQDLDSTGRAQLESISSDKRRRTVSFVLTWHRVPWPN